MERVIDINSDVGERPAALQDGTEEQLIRLICSANVACGGHAGDESTMTGVIRIARTYGVSLGAHPGYPDRVNFGRMEIPMPLPDLERSVYEQVRSIGTLAQNEGINLRHVKPHGALYNVAHRKPEIAKAIAEGVGRYSSDLLLFGLAGSPMLEVWTDYGFRVVAEAFADRRYEADGTLRSRRFSDAVISDPASAAEQAVRMVMQNAVIAADGSRLRVEAQTLCVHGDTPHALQIVREIRKRFAKGGIGLEPIR